MLELLISLVLITDTFLTVRLLVCFVSGVVCLSITFLRGFATRVLIMLVIRKPNKKRAETSY